MTLLAQVQRLLQLGSAPRWSLPAACTSVVLAATVSTLPPVYVGRIVDALQQHNFTNVMRFLGFYLGISIISNLLGVVQGYSATVFRETLVRNLRIALLASLAEAKLESLASFSPGSVMNRVLGGVGSISTQLQYTIIPTVASLCAIVATLAAMTRLDVRFALIAVAFSALSLIPLRLASRCLAPLQRAQAEALDELSDEVHASTNPQGLTLLRNPHAASHILSRFLLTSKRWYKATVSQEVLQEATSTVTTLFTVLGPAAILAVGAYQTAHGASTPGMVVTALIYQARISAPFAAISSLQIAVVSLRIAVDRLSELLDLPRDRGGSQVVTSAPLSMVDVEFTRGRQTILRGVTLTLASNAHVGIMGPSGSGKSTLALLLAGFIEPFAGQVCIGGLPLACFSRRSLRLAISLVPQEPSLYNGSLYDNLTLTCDTVTKDQIQEALHDCAFNDVLGRLPDGLDSNIGQRGSALSGGERQRLCVARALLQNPTIMILDEALSGVDIDTEQVVLSRLAQRLKNAILIVISHRPQTMQLFEHIYLVSGGNVTEALRPYASLVHKAEG